MSGRFNGKREYESDRPRQDQRHYHTNQQGSWGNQRDRYPDDQRAYHNDHRPHQHDQREQGQRNQQQWGHGQSQLNSSIPRKGRSFERSQKQPRNDSGNNAHVNPSPFSAGNDFTPESKPSAGNNVRNVQPPADGHEEHIPESLADLGKAIGGYTSKEWAAMSHSDTLAKFDALNREQQLDLLLPKNKRLLHFPAQVYTWDWSNRLEKASKEIQEDIDREFKRRQMVAAAAKKNKRSTQYPGYIVCDENDSESDDSCMDPLERMAQDPKPQEQEKHFIRMLTRCPVMTMGFNITDLCLPQDEKNCFCPCSSNHTINRWQEVFGLEGLIGTKDRSSNNPCSFKQRKPFELMAHLRDVGTKSRLHALTHKFLTALYRDHYGPGIPHIGVCVPLTPEYHASEAAKTKAIRNQQRLLQEQSDKAQQYKEELDRIKDEKQALEKVNQDLYKKLELRNAILAPLKKPVVDKKCINQSKTTCTNALRLFARFCGPVNMEDVGAPKITLRMQPADTLNQTFSKWFEQEEKNELFSDELSPDQIAKFFLPLDVRYAAESHLKVEAEDETVAKDEGGPARQFLSTLWRGLGDLEVVKTFTDFEADANGVYQEVKTVCRCQLFEAAELGFVPQSDEMIHYKFRNAKGHDKQDLMRKVESYYRAVGRCMAHSLLSMHGQLGTNKEAENSKSAHSCVIDGQALPSLFRSYLFRGVSPDNESYETHDFMSHIMDIVMTIKLEETGEQTEKLLFQRILPPVELKPEDDKWALARREMTERYIEGRSIALGALYDGLSLGGTIDPKVCFPESCPPAALNVVMFSASNVTIDDFLEKNGSHRILQKRPAKSDLKGMDAAATEIYYERYQTLMTDLATLLRAQDESFLSNFLFHCTGQYYVPNLDIHQDFKINVELSLEVPADGLPTVHTCTKDLLFPHNAYDNDTEKLEEKLKQSMGYSAGKWSMV